MPEMTTAAKPGIDAMVDRLIAILTRQASLQCELHERLLEKRNAVAHADMEVIERLCRTENELARALGSLEQERINLLASLTRKIDAAASDPMTVSAIAAHVGGDRGEELRTLTDAIRSRLREMHALTSVLKDATEALNRHIAGVMQVVHSSFSNTRMYERRGRIHCGTQIASTLDVTS